MTGLMSMLHSHMFDKKSLLLDENGPTERRSGIERRVFSYSWYIPERRFGADKREYIIDSENHDRKRRLKM